jgi:S1-C subfamily serine protease
MHEPERSPCPRCARPAAVEALRCPHCRGSLATDVVVAAAIDDERQRYHVARTLADLGPPLPGLAKLREVLARAGSTLVRGVSRGTADRMIAALAAQGVRATARLADPGRPPGAAAPRVIGRMGRTGVLAVAFGLLMLAIAGGSGLIYWAGSTRAGTVTTQPLSRAQLTEIGDRVRRARAYVHGTGAAAGYGAFVAPDLVLARAAGAGRDAVRVDYPGRTAAKGTIAQADADVGLVLVRVEGARADPLAVADATTIKDGDVLVVVDQSPGRTLAVNATVTNASATRENTSLIQIEASLGSSPSGSPVVDARGRVVGLVWGALPDAKLAWVVPVNYAFDWLPAVPHDRTAWERRLAAPREAIAARDATFAAATDRPVLLQTRYLGIQKFGPSQEILQERFAFLVAGPVWARDEGSTPIQVRIGPCDLEPRVRWWPDAFRRRGGQPPALQIFERWADSQGVGSQTVIGDAEATLDRSQCPTGGAREVSQVHRGEVVSTIPLDER